jgi:SAM-dependent methyltransferase
MCPPIERMNLRERIPWWAKLGAKIVLSRLPLGYRSWSRIGIFQLGAMVDPDYALGVFRFHLTQARVSAEEPARLVVLELGPGDSLLSAPIAWAFGAQRCYLVDGGDFASRELVPFHELLKRLAAQSKDISGLAECTGWPEILSRCNAQYLTKGLDSLRGIPDNSVDLIWSQAVLEHVPRAEFRAVMREFRRILRDEGRCSHTVDLTDHLGNSLNNLRFSEALWEGSLFSKSGFYTNRIRFEEMLGIFRESKFAIASVNRKKWGKLPISRTKLAPEFSSLPEDDLLTLGFDVVLRPSG